MDTWIDECLAEIDDMCILFIKDDWSAANSCMRKVLSKLENILADMNMRQQELNTDIMEQYSLNFLNIVGVAKQAMENEDGIQLSDLMGYDMRNLLIKYKNEIKTAREE